MWKSPRISPDRRSGRGVPQSTLFTLAGPPPTPTENRRQAGSALQTDILAQNGFRWRDDPFHDLEIKKFATQKCSLERLQTWESSRTRGRPTTTASPDHMQR